jgi:hypothetical protein
LGEGGLATARVFKRLAYASFPGSFRDGVARKK